MPSSIVTAKVGMYWDFENIHASLFDQKFGNGSYGGQTRQNQAALMNLPAIMEYAASIGDVVVNRAYCNWSSFGSYHDALNRYGVDLIQLYPKGGNAKNGADIRLALDVLEDLAYRPHLTHIIVVGSDSDFISLAQKVKQSGRVIIGIGVKGSTNSIWEQCCNEFKYYNTLLGIAGSQQEAAQAKAKKPSVATPKADAPAKTAKTPPAKKASQKPAAVATAPGPPPKVEQPAGLAEGPGDEPGDIPDLTLEEAQGLMLRAMRQLMTKRDDGKIQKGELKSVMIRLDSRFDENNFGYRTFTDFVNTLQNTVETINDMSGGWVKLKEVSPV